MTEKSQAYIGTSGWAYPEWKGGFYPKGLKDRDRLSFYAGIFNAVEINNSFYRQPDPTYVARWTESVPDDFRICFKLWRGVTHDKRLKDSLHDIDVFLGNLEPARPKWGPLLLQLPPGMDRKSAYDLEAVLLHLQSRHVRCAVECRHASWYHQDIYALLARTGAALVLHDMPGSASIHIDLPQDFYYLRHHGAGRKYGGSYDGAYLQNLQERIGYWGAAGRDVYVFFNNTMGAAVDNARQLQAALR